MSDNERLDALEQRVTDLEAQLERIRAESPAPPAPDPDTFWALEGLRARADAPGAVLMTGHVRLPDGRTARWQQSATTGELLEDDWADNTDVLAALGHPVRMRLLQHLLRGATTVHDLTRIDGMGTSGQVYHHLRQLSSAGWLRARGGGRYEVPVDRIVPLLTFVLGTQR